MNKEEKLNKNLNKVFDITENFEHTNHLPVQMKQQILTIIGKLKEDEISEYCRDSLHSIIEKTKDIFEIVLDETKFNPTPNNVKNFSALLTALTNSITALDKIDEGGSRKPDIVNNNLIVDSDEVIEKLRKRGVVK